MNIELSSAGQAAKPQRPIFAARARSCDLQSQAMAMRAAVVCAFSQMLDLRDLNTGMHSTRLAEWGLRVARSLGVPEHSLPDLETGALLHDIGKVAIPESILGKPARLTHEEFEIVKRHPEFGWTVIRNLPGLEHTSLQILHHHENFDGTGYPAGLKGTEIPIGARIVSVIDSFDAMISNRPYRAGLPMKEVIRRLHESSGTQFDPLVVDAFVRIVEAEMPIVLEAVGSTVSGTPSR
jgi:HD-GYP domain-containing protein (c-di-GMP phosphodiesterase class II)